MKLLILPLIFIMACGQSTVSEVTDQNADSGNTDSPTIPERSPSEEKVPSEERVPSEVTEPMTEHPKVDSRLIESAVQNGTIRSNETESKIEVNLEVAANCVSSFITEMTDSKVSERQVGIRSYRLNVDTKYITDESYAEKILNDRCIIRLSPIFRLRRSDLGNDPLTPSQEHLTQIKLDDAIEALDLEKDFGSSVIIAVIDSGVDFTHEDLKENAWYNVGEIGDDANGVPKHKNGIDDDNNGYVDDCMGYNFAENLNSGLPSLAAAYHGTHVAGLAAARSNNGVGIRGVNGRAKIMALNVFGPFDGAVNSDTENAIRYATDNGADVINLSLGHAGYSPSMEAAIAYANSRNVSVVIASGNSRKIISADRNSAEFDTPASLAAHHPGVIAVSSIDARDDFPSPFSNFSGEVVQIAAPGCQFFNAEVVVTDGVEELVAKEVIGLLSTGTENRYLESCGTSQAAPIVAGAISLLIAKLKSEGLEINNVELRKHLAKTGDINSKLNDLVIDSKMLNVNNLLSTSMNDSPDPVVNEEQPSVSEDDICLTGIIVK